MGSEKQKSPETSHKPGLAVLIVFTFVVLIFAVAINYLSSSPIGREAGMFVSNSTGDVSDKHYLEITPAGWTFFIWLFIYALQLIWMIYVIIGLFRKNSDGGPLYAYPETQTPLMYLIYVFNLGCNVAWVLLFDREYVGWCLIPAAFLPCTLYAVLAISHMRLMKNGNHMTQNGMRKDIWLVRILIQNGIAVYATWTSIAFLLNMAMVLAYRADFDQSLSCTISLFLLMVEVAVWFTLDIFVFERYTRYLVMPYCVVCFALSGSLAKNYDPTKNNTIATIVLIGVGGTCLVFKLLLMFIRHCTRPIFPSAEQNQRVSEAEA